MFLDLQPITLPLVFQQNRGLCGDEKIGCNFDKELKHHKTKIAVIGIYFNKLKLISRCFDIERNSSLLKLHALTTTLFYV